jgi:histidinol-phosphatase (PHP family)
VTRLAPSSARLPGDYHIHTTFSDGRDSVEDCVRRAVALGLAEVGIADHLAVSEATAWDLASMPATRLGDYVDEVFDVAARHSDITVLLGVEADYLPQYEAELAALLAAHPFQYVVGGVHVLDGFAFDEPEARDDSRWSEPDSLFRANYRTVSTAAQYGRFDVIAHLDYVGLWGHWAGPEIDPEIDAALGAMARCGCAIELNTDRISDPAGVMYPSPDILRRAHARGIPLVISSDAHQAEHVGRFWNEAVAVAREAGYRETLRLSDRTLGQLPGDSGAM